MLMSLTDSSPVNSNDACMSIVNSLLCHRQGGESQNFSRKAIESLVKKLKEKREELDSLITAVTTSGTQPTGCVTIPKTLDGRLQIAGRKCFPHVIYARIWRWPNLHKNELRQNKCCIYGYEMKLDYVCINPYHYDRVVPSAVDISELSLTSSIEDLDETESPSAMDSESVNETLKYISNSSNGAVRSKSIKNSVNHGYRYDSLHMRARMTLQYGGNNGDYALDDSDPLKARVGQSLDVQSMSDSSGSPSDQFKPRIGHEGDSVPTTIKYENSVVAHYCQNSPSNGNFKIASLTGRGGSQNSQSSSANQQQNQSQRNSNQSAQPAQQQSRPNFNNSSSSWNQNQGFDRPPTTSAQPLQALTHQRPPEYWCTIAYFELNQQVGELFKVPSQYSCVTVDGYTDPSSPNRFCLGQLSNVHRSESSEKSRLYIGKGVELNNVGEGDVWIRCLSAHSVFVQSYYLDREAGRQPGDAVHKIYPGAYIKVFDIRQCHQQMKKASTEAQLAWVRQAAVVAGSSNSITSTIANQGSNSMNNLSAAGIGVDDLSPFCVLRLSFVKGWGPDYPRHNIKETPCWIEIKLNRPLQLLDEVLQSMSVNEYKPTRHFFANYYNQSQSGLGPSGPLHPN